MPSVAPELQAVSTAIDLTPYESTTFANRMLLDEVRRTRNSLQSAERAVQERFEQVEACMAWLEWLGVDPLQSACVFSPTGRAGLLEHLAKNERLL